MSGVCEFWCMFVHSDKQQCTACVVLLAAYSQRVRCVLWSQLTRALGMHICSIYIYHSLVCHTYICTCIYIHAYTYLHIMHVRMYVCMCILIYVQDTYSEITAHPQYPPPPPTDGAPLTLRLCPSVTSATKGGAPFLIYMLAFFCVCWVLEQRLCTCGTLIGYIRPLWSCAWSDSVSAYSLSYGLHQCTQVMCSVGVHECVFKVLHTSYLLAVTTG